MTDGARWRVIAGVALTMSAMMGVAPAIGAQSTRVGGSIGVSLTILPPVHSAPMRVVGFDVDRNGLATLETTAPTSSSVSLIVMSAVTREAAVDSNPRRRASVVSPTETSAPLRHQIDLGAPRLNAPAVRLRVSYLTVAGT